jgi:hypothetical protein
MSETVFSSRLPTSSPGYRGKTMNSIGVNIWWRISAFEHFAAATIWLP